MLLLIVMLLFCFILISPFFRANDVLIVQKISLKVGLLFSGLCFFIASNIWLLFDRSSVKFQFLWTDTIFFDNSGVVYNSYLANLLCSFGVDGISIFFLLLTTFTVPLCLLTAWKQDFIQRKYFILYFILLEFFLVLAFTALDLMLFFIFFESILIPMFFLIGIWGSKERRVRAAFYLMLYTIAGSVLLFFVLITLYFEVGSTSMCVLSKVVISLEKQKLLWLFVYFAFSVKIPTIPVHIWLPEAHVEAPTAGSVILAGLLLKLGGYGFIRVLLPIFSQATTFFLPLVYTLSLISIIYASLTTIRQVDLKRIIAYSSIAHMNLVVLGIFSGNIQGVQGSIFLMLAHGVVSAALFFLIGVVYDKYHTRLLQYYGGLVQTMPLFSVQLFIFSFANIGAPGTCNFIGELVVFVGLVDRNFFVLLIALIGVVLSAVYSLFFLNRLVFGNLKTRYIYTWQDLTKVELAILLPLCFLTIFLGVCPNVIFDTTLSAVFYNGICSL